MSISASYPNLRPTLLLDFANSGRMDPRVTFSRASTATYYDAATSSLAEQNLLVQSQNFATTWFTTNASVATDSTTAPDGTSTADTITDDATSAPHSVTQAVGMAVAVDFTFSCFLQAGTSNYAFISLTDFSSPGRYATVVVDLSAGTITDTDDSAGTTASSSITSVGSGWYRVSVTAQRSPDPFSHARVGISDSGTPSYNTFGAPTYSGSGSTIYVWGAQLERRSSAIVYTPTTTQPITNYVPTLLTAANNVPRFDYDPVTRGARGLLIEEARTNLTTYSEQIDNADWTKSGLNTTGTPAWVDVEVAPDGNITADKLTEDTSTGEHATTQTFSFTAGTVYTMSIFAKAAERTLIRVGAGNPNTWAAGVVVDLTTGTITSTIAGSGSVQDVGNGWYRISVTGTALLTASTGRSIRLVSTGTTISYTGDGTSGAYIWGAQFEAGAFPTSYIPTTSTALTRSADVASVNTLSPWFNASSGTIYFEGTTSNSTSGGFPTAYQFTDGTANNRIQLVRNNASGNARFAVFDGGVSQAAADATAWTLNATTKTALGYAVNDFALVANGGTVTTDTSGTVPSVNNFLLGTYVGGIGQLGGHIRRITYYPVRLSNAQLQAITA